MTFESTLAICCVALMAEAADIQPQLVPGNSNALVAVGGEGPRIQFDSTTYDFGKLKQAESVKHTFAFTNTGSSTLEILDVKPGCGCTTAGAWDRKVEPGKSGSIPLQFNSAGFGGPVSKSATVTCNDPTRSNVVLVLSGSVWRAFEILPMQAVFQVDSENQTNETKVLRITSHLEEPVHLSDLRLHNPQFKAELAETKPGSEFELRITTLPPFTNTSFASIFLKTSSTQAPSLSLSAYAVLQQPLIVSPQQVMLPIGPLASSITSTVTLYYRGTNSLKASDPATTAPDVQVSLREPQPGKVFVLQAIFPAQFKAQSNGRSELTVKTDHPRFPLVRVPIYQSEAVVAPQAAARPPAAAQPQPVTGGERQVPVRPSANKSN